MTKDQSLNITAYLSGRIAGEAPYVPYTLEEVLRDRENYSDEQIRALKQEGFLPQDHETFTVIKRFCDGMGLWDRADRGYLRKLFSQARRLDAEDFRQDPYLKTVPVKEARVGRFLLLNASYERGEILQYDMPDLDGNIVVPKLGFFPQEVTFPAVYEGETPWVSVCPSEINSMGRDIDAAHGRVLVLGLGLGYYPFRIGEKKEVREIVIVERSREIIELFETHLLPHFPCRDKIRVVGADAFDYLAKTEPGRFDFCYADIWEGMEDGMAAYRRIKPMEASLPGTEFRYWIEKEIRWGLESTPS